MDAVTSTGLVTGGAEQATRAHPGEGAVADGDLPVHQGGQEPLRSLLQPPSTPGEIVDERRHGGTHRGGVEDVQVGHHTGPQQAAI